MKPAALAAGITGAVDVRELQVARHAGSGVAGDESFLPFVRDG